MNKMKFALAVTSIVILPLSVNAETVSPIVEKFEHKERSTIDTFPFQAIESDELSNAVIEGGLEPTSAGPDTSKAVRPAYQDNKGIETVDRQTDLGRHEVPIQFNYREPSTVPGQVRTYSSQLPLPANRTYSAYDSNTNFRP